MSSRVGWEWTRWRRLWTKSRKRRRRRRRRRMAMMSVELVVQELST
jgi:hypothetical protein